MFPRKLVITLTFAFFFAACDRGPAKSGGAEQKAPEKITAETAPEQDLAPVLAELTQNVRKYSAEQRRVPQSLNELVAAGYLKEVPAAPAGKAFFIDTKGLKVGVK
jgi:hypothetical protein